MWRIVVGFFLVEKMLSVSYSQYSGFLLANPPLDAPKNVVVITERGGVDQTNVQFEGDLVNVGKYNITEEELKYYNIVNQLQKGMHKRKFPFLKESKRTSPSNQTSDQSTDRQKSIDLVSKALEAAAKAKLAQKDADEAKKLADEATNAVKVNVPSATAGATSTPTPGGSGIAPTIQHCRRYSSKMLEEIEKSMEVYTEEQFMDALSSGNGDVRNLWDLNKSLNILSPKKLGYIKTLIQNNEKAKLQQMAALLIGNDETDLHQCVLNVANSLEESIA